MAQSFGNKLRNLFCYCGVSKVEYNRIKKKAYAVNFDMWKNLHMVLAIIMGVLFVFTVFTSGNLAPARAYLLPFIYCTIVSFIFARELFGRESLVAQLAIYLTMIVMLVDAAYISVSSPNELSVMFICCLVLVPMFMIDKPYYVALVIAMAAAIFSVLVEMFKAPDVATIDVFNAVLFGIVSIVINLFYNYLRVQELLTANELERGLVELEKANYEIEDANAALGNVNDGVVNFLGDIAEWRTREDSNSGLRVRVLTYLLAMRVMEDQPKYHLSEREVDRIARASVLHDLGKVGLPDYILQKPTPLTPNERMIMESHCAIGCQMIMSMKDVWDSAFLQTAMDICHYHHERWDGGGYPRALQGDDIPLSAQIVSIVDVYDALTHERAYKEAYSHEEACQLIMDGECGAFSEGLLGCFERCSSTFYEVSNNPVLLGEILSKSSARKTSDSSILTGMSILLVDHDLFTREIGVNTLRGEGAIVTEASSGREAVSIINENRSFDTILMNVALPEFTGADAIRGIRAIETPTDIYIPIIAIAADPSDPRIQECLDAGADGFSTKPVEVSELSRTLMGAMREHSARIKKRLEVAMKSATTDSLTGLKNVSAYMEKTAQLNELVQQGEAPQFCITICDVDELKRENDTFGHPSGDTYIKNCARIICTAFAHSPVYRIGGDEFAVISEGRDYANVQEILRVMALRVEEARKIATVEEGRASFSFGMAAFDATCDDMVSNTAKRADAAMYTRKFADDK